MLAATAGAFLVPTMLLEMGESGFLFVVGLTTNLVGFGLILLVVGAQAGPTRTPPGLVLRLAARIGAASYAIYLWHLTWKLRVDFQVTPHTGPVVGLIVYVAGAVMVGMLLTWLIEWPVLRLRERWSPSRATA